VSRISLLGLLTLLFIDEEMNDLDGTLKADGRASNGGSGSVATTEIDCPGAKPLFAHLDQVNL